MENTLIKTPCAELSWIIPNKIMRSVYLDGSSLEGAKEHTRLLMKHFSIDDAPITALADLTQLKGSPSKEVRDYFASDEITALANASAMLLKSGISKIVGNIFLKFNNPGYPTKLFTNEAKAIEWLKTFL